jgi:hypothetical protein
VINPGNATDQAVTWSTTDGSIASVAPGSVLKATVTAGSLGTATITVTTHDGSKQGSCTVTVTNEAINSTIYVAGPFGLYVDGAHNAAIGNEYLQDVFVDDQHIHAAGYHYNSSMAGGWEAAYYKDGAPTILPPHHNIDYERASCADSLFIAANGDVYISGYEEFTDSNYSWYGHVARLWKNAVFQTLSGIDETGYVYSEGKAVRVHNGIVYVVGFDWDYDLCPAIWKDGVLYANYGMSDDEFQPAIIDFGIASNGDLYVLVQNWEPWAYDGSEPDDYDNAVYRVNPNSLGSSWNWVMGGDGDNFPEHVFVEGSDVYAAGWRYDENDDYPACYWKNGAPYDLAPPAGNIASYVEAHDIYVLNGHLYIAGIYRSSADSKFHIVEWIDGVVVTGNTAIAAAFENKDNATPHAIFAK